jgi:hypothetical protein
VTDGSECYDEIRDYRCLFHKMRNFFAIDPFLERAWKEKALPPSILSAHMRDVYSFAEDEYEGWLKERYIRVWSIQRIHRRDDHKLDRGR